MYDDFYAAFAPSRMDPNLALAFAGSNWSAMSPSQRLQALQRLENHFAQVFARPALEVRTLEASRAQEGLMGYFANAEGRMYIHPRYLQNPALGLSDFSAAGAMMTVLHEGRHGYQWHSATGRAGRVPDGQVTEWAMNYCRYFGGGDASETDLALYYFQPVEMDARRFARRGAEEFARRIAGMTGGDDGFRRTLDLDRRSEEQILMLGRRALTPELLSRADAEARAAFLRYNPDASVAGIRPFGEARRLLFPGAACRPAAMGFNLPPQWDGRAACFAPRPTTGFPATFALRF